MADTAMDIFQEIADINRMLKDIQRGTKLLLSPEPSTPKSIKHQESSTSSWAKSSSPRLVTPINKSEGSVIISEDNLMRAEKVTRVRQPSFSIGSRHNSDSKCKRPDVVDPKGITQSNINLTISSKYKRSRSSVFGTATRLDLFDKPLVSHSNKNVPNVDDTKNYTIGDHNTTKGFRFGSAKRESLAFNTQTSSQAQPLDVDKANKWIHERVSTPVMKPLTVIAESPNSKDLQKPISSQESVLNVAVLSHVISTPGIKIKLPCERTPQLRAMDSEKAKESLVGPGRYNVSISDFDSTKKSGVLYKNASKEKEEAVIKRQILEDNFTNNIGPGYYDIVSADDFIRTKSFSARIQNKNVSDISLPLQKKRYLEEKAQDAREYHDDQLPANENLLRPRTPSTIISNKSVLTSDPKLFKIHQQRKSEKIEESTILDVNMSITEKRSSSMVNMEAEAKARVSMSKFLSQKPRAQEVIADKYISKDVLYGPQLPISWADDKLPAPSSPTRDVQALLDSRNKHVSITAEAFLRSSLSGNSRNLPTVNMNERVPTESKKLQIDEADHVGLGLIDWTEELNHRENQYKHNSVRMDMSRGRDIVRYHSKGIAEVIEFNNTTLGIDDSDVPGPYTYQPNNLLDFGSDTKGIVKFDNYVSREDARGPNGERPESYARSIGDVLEDEELYTTNRLDIDHRAVIDNDRIVKKRTPAISLYQKDRIIGPKVIEASDHVGGTWFKGMAEEAVTQAATVDYDRMQGRKNSEDAELLQSDLGLKIIKEGNVLDLELKNPAISDGIKANAVLFKDPVKYPRFEEHESRSDHILDISPNFEYSKKRDPTSLMFVDMNKMKGRNEEEDNLIQEVIHGGISNSDAVKYEKECLSNVSNSETSKVKRSVSLVKMDKQTGRSSDENNLKSDEMMIDTTDSNRNDNDFGANAKGISQWKNQDDEYPVLHNESDKLLILDLDKPLEIMSKYKTSQSGPAWKYQDSEERLQLAKQVSAPDAIYEDVDSGKFKKGLARIGEGKNSAIINSLTGRDPIREESIDYSEEVILDLKDDKLRPRTKGGQISKSRESLIPVQIFDHEELDLAVKEPKKKVSSLSIAKQQGRENLSEFNEFDQEREEVIVEPKNKVLSTHKNIASYTMTKEVNKGQDWEVIGEDPFVSYKPKLNVVIAESNTSKKPHINSVTPKNKTKVETQSPLNRKTETSPRQILESSKKKVNFAVEDVKVPKSNAEHETKSKAPKPSSAIKNQSLKKRPVVASTSSDAVKPLEKKPTRPLPENLEPSPPLLNPPSVHGIAPKEGFAVSEESTGKLFGELDQHLSHLAIK